MRLQFYLFCILFLVSIASCKKPAVETVLIPQELKDYTIFPEGSWWIYEEQHTGLKDSSYVFENECQFLEGEYARRTSCDCQKLEICYTGTVSRNDSITSQSVFFSSNTENDGYIYIHRETNHSKTQTLRNHLLVYPIDSLGQQVPFNGGHIITALDDTLSVGGRLYFNTISVSDEGVVSEHGGVPFNIKKAIFAEGVGKVYAHYHDGTIWILKDYFINN